MKIEKVGVVTPALSNFYVFVWWKKVRAGGEIFEKMEILYQFFHVKRVFLMGWLQFFDAFS